MPILLTEAAVRRLRPARQRRIIRDSGSRSLFLTIQTSGFKSWAMRFRRPDGGSSKIVLGPYDLSGRSTTDEPQVGEPLSLARARQLAARVVSDRAAGVDVVGRHKSLKLRRRVAFTEAAGNSFLRAVTDFISEQKRRVRTWKKLARNLGLDEDLEPRPGGLVSRWATRDVATITAADLHLVIEESRKFGIPGVEVRSDKATDSRGHVIHTSLSAMFRWLHRRRRVETNPMVQLYSTPPSAARDRVLSEAEICKFWEATGSLKTHHGDALKLLMLTGARLNEIVRLSWSEVSDDASTLNIGAERVKNGLPLVIPLAAMARDIIARQPQSESFIFALNSVTPMCLGSKVKNQIDAAMGDVPPWRFHDIRRTAATGMAAIGIQPHVIDAVLNHVSGHRAGVAGVYNRHAYLNEKREALQLWEAHLLSLVGGER
jgi:integrase